MNLRGDGVLYCTVLEKNVTFKEETCEAFENKNVSEPWQGRSGIEYRPQLPFQVKKCDQTFHDVPEEIAPCTVIETENCEVHIQKDRITIQPKDDICITRITRVTKTLEIHIRNRELFKEHFPENYVKLVKDERDVKTYFSVWKGRKGGSENET